MGNPFSFEVPAFRGGRLSRGSFCFLGPLQFKDDLRGTDQESVRTPIYIGVSGAGRPGSGMPEGKVSPAIPGRYVLWPRGGRMGGGAHSETWPWVPG